MNYPFPLLQGFTDFVLEMHKTRFLEVSILFMPYIRLNGKMVIKSSYQRDLLPENNNTLGRFKLLMTQTIFYLSLNMFRVGYKRIELEWVVLPYGNQMRNGLRLD
jgi:hypothetical protein